MKVAQTDRSLIMTRASPTRRTYAKDMASGCDGHARESHKDDTLQALMHWALDVLALPTVCRKRFVVRDALASFI